MPFSRFYKRKKWCDRIEGCVARTKGCADEFGMPKKDKTTKNIDAHTDSIVCII